MNTTEKKQTLVEEGTEFNGSMRSNCAVVVHGTFDGQIEAPELEVADTGAVQGTVKAGRLRSDGILAGSIDAEEVYLSGAVCSNTKIRASKLELKLSQESGKLEITFGEHAAATVTQSSSSKGRGGDEVVTTHGTRSKRDLADNGTKSNGSS